MPGPSAASMAFAPLLMSRRSPLASQMNETIDAHDPRTGRCSDSEHAKRCAFTGGPAPRFPHAGRCPPSDTLGSRDSAIAETVARRFPQWGNLREVVAELDREGMSTRAIASAVGVGKSTVDRDLTELSQAGQLTERVIGEDGKSRPAKVTQTTRTTEATKVRLGAP